MRTVMIKAAILRLRDDALWFAYQDLLCISANKDLVSKRGKGTYRNEEMDPFVYQKHATFNS